MNDYGLSTENLIRVFPPALQKDEKMLALAAGFARKLPEVAENVKLARIYTRIDELPEGLLDILAYDFKVDWWDLDYDLEEKRQTLKDSWYIHRHLGTKNAVEKAISAIFKNSRVLEWFDYGGEPYTFRIEIGISQTGTTGEKQTAVLDRVKYYKNLRSHLDTVSYRIKQNGQVYTGGASSIGAMIEAYPYLVGELESIGQIYTGATVQTARTIEIYPYLVSGLEATGQICTGAAAQTTRTIEIYSEEV